MSELASVCSIFFAECIAFLQSSEPAPEPEPEPEPAVPAGPAGACRNSYLLRINIGITMITVVKLWWTFLPTVMCCGAGTISSMVRGNVTR